MSKNFKHALQVGKIGEEIAQKILPNCSKCWHRNVVQVVENGKVTHESSTFCTYNPKVIDVRDDKWYQQTDDVDFILECDCPFTGEHCTSTHEVKTNIGTYASANPTQNIVIETVESVRNYATGQIREVTNEKNGETRQVRIGIGWYNKRIDGTKATWYHFFQPFINPQSKEVHATIIRATDEENRAWLEDERVADGSGLITKFPLDYMLSITGNWLKHIIDEGHYKEVPFATNRGYLIPIIDIVTGFEVCEDGSIQLKESRFCNPKEVLWHVTDKELLIKKNTGHTGNPDKKLYIPQRLLDEVESTYRDFKSRNYKGRGKIELPSVMVYLCEKAIPYPIA